MWRETIYDRLSPLEITKIGDRPFEGAIEAADLGSMLVTRVSSGATRTRLTAEALRRSDKDATVTVAIMLSGVSTFTRDDREAVQRPGDIVVLDRRPGSTQSSDDSRALFLEIPAHRLESMLGSARQFAALNIASDQASASLVRTFFDELVQIHEQLDPETAARMSSIGIDLLVASIAERMARDVPTGVDGNLVVQRAKAYIETNLHDPTLDPPHLAAAVGVPLRRLQELFHARGRHVSDWIWGRRLDVAALRLTDPGCGHLAIGLLAHGCGFSSQAHFSRRFRDRFGMTPSEYRHAARLAAASAP
ncbi:MAG: helix-turn-helix domain-containing protein [Methylobacterium sp.]|uniref:helix-turn-helix domain-containing protein n=1 Tax=Methylobacterium sp. TaxID=409 RepID=UPI002724EE70|nr:helix-turn-helix domain-containing protein [Methylobacterium sp.]MDO9428554.1 helix-turn-helix domain-containing protein [Methylobacterium sp.]